MYSKVTIFISFISIISVKSGRRLLGFNFKSTNPIGQKQCLKLCFVHTDCLSINFSRNRLLCELNSQQESHTTTVTENSPEAEDFIYIPRQSIPQDIISLTGACSTVTCLPGQMCIAHSGGKKSTCIVARMYKLQDVAKERNKLNDWQKERNLILLSDPETHQLLLANYSPCPPKILSLPLKTLPKHQQEGCLGEPPPGQLTSYVTNTSESYVGSSRGYACAVGTVPERVNQTTCLANGHWETPRCQVCIEASDPTGENYSGTKNITETGKICQRWNSQSPHQHNYPNNPENYCRNPDSEPTPWCYTIDPNVRWENCSIPTC
ncbi:uncharacterized protein LOC130054916 [Ostrea edulis]|uniref:uncharacterized protein LOC130054916 n=1 Tax=Ostrea edulis TaxID=37623 RepID=UPI0024AEE9C7|nr:uncharacterized protein LOC130054916 [Ostrea edulis]